MSDDIYQKINLDKTIPQWERRIRKNSAANTGNAFLTDLLPFMKKIRPKVPKTQSVFGNLTLICLEGDAYKNSNLIEEGLNPLISGGVLTKDEADNFSKWLSKKTTKEPKKSFSIDGIKYELSVDNYPESYRDVILHIEKGNEGKGMYPRYCLGTGCTAFGGDGNCYSQSKCDWVPNQPEKRGKLKK